MDRKQDLKAFLRDLHKVQENAIFFLEEYWNKLHPDKKLDLTDEEKQRIFDQNKLTVPLLSDDESFKRYVKAHEEAKKKGIKDWENY